MSKKSNVIQTIPLLFDAKSHSTSFNLNISFPVKRIRYVCSSWNSSDLKFGTYGFGYISSNLKDNDGFICLLENTNNKSFEYTLPEPKVYQGRYTFNVHTPDGVYYPVPADLWAIVVLEFLQE